MKRRRRARAEALREAPSGWVGGCGGGPDCAASPPRGSVAGVRRSDPWLAHISTEHWLGDAVKLIPMARRAPRWRGGRHFY